MSKKNKFLVSLLKAMYDTHPETVTLDAIYQYLILDTLRSDTEKHRYYKSAGLKKEAQDTKNSMLNFAPSVILSGGKSEEDIVGYTGLGFSDFDHLPSEDVSPCFALLNADPYVVLAYITISGEGIRVIYNTDVTDARCHDNVFLQGNEYYARLLGHKYDAQCSNIARTSILCHCPQAIYHPNAEAMHIELTSANDKASKKKRKGRPTKHYETTADAIERHVLRLLEKDGKQYTSNHHNEYISSALYQMNRYGVSEEDARLWAVERFADYGIPAVESIVHSVFRHTEEHGTEKIPSDKENRIVYATLHEIEQFITSQAKIRHNTLTDRREIWLNGEKGFRDLTDRDENTLWVRANKAGVYSGPKVVQLVLNSEFVESYNPLTSYLYGLDTWNGTTDYIGRLADTVKTREPELFREYFRKWFVGVIASIVDPSVVNQEVLVLIGEQGHYKTTWMNRLLPTEWKSYFFTKTNSNHMTKDDHLSLSEFVLLCFEEIDNMRPSEMNQFKAMVTLSAINERSPYARNKSHRPHVASFCGTGNNVTFLNDPTGTRRWLAFEVLAIDNPYAMQLPYREIYAQGLALYRSGFRYWFEQDEIKILSHHNQQFEVPCIEQELVMTYYRKPTLGEHGIFVSTAEILQRINAQIKVPLSLTALGTAMRKLGYYACRSNSIRGYRVVELTQSEMNARKQVFDLPSEQALDF